MIKTGTPKCYESLFQDEIDREAKNQGRNSNNNKNRGDLLSLFYFGDYVCCRINGLIASYISGHINADSN